MKAFNFATTLVESHSYVGEQALEYILACFLKNRTADSGVRVVTDIIKSAFVAKLAGSNLVQCGDNCTFSPTGTLTATEVELTPCTMYINIELCYNDLVGLWNGLSSGDLNSQDLGADFNRALVEVLVKTMGEYFEDVIWNGSTTGSSGYTLTGCTCAVSGIDSLITTHALHTTGVTITKSNVVGYVDELIASLPSCILEDTSKLKIYMNPKTFLYYRQALMSLGINTPCEVDCGSTYDGIPIYVVGKIDDNKMYAIQPENIVIGVGSMDNFSYVKVLDMREQTLDNSVRMAIQGKVDVKLIYEAEAAKLG
jgi:hypothetical protein